VRALLKSDLPSLKSFKLKSWQLKNLLEFDPSFLFPTKFRLFQFFLKSLPNWYSGWEFACQCRGQGWGSCSERIPHAMEQLGLCTITTEPLRLEQVLSNKRSHLRSWSTRKGSTCSLRESPQHSNKDPSRPKRNNFSKFNALIEKKKSSKLLYHCTHKIETPAFSLKYYTFQRNPGWHTQP